MIFGEKGVGGFLKSAIGMQERSAEFQQALTEKAWGTLGSALTIPGVWSQATGHLDRDLLRQGVMTQLNKIDERPSHVEGVSITSDMLGDLVNQIMAEYPEDAALIEQIMQRKVAQMAHAY